MSPTTRRDPPLPAWLLALCFFGSGLTGLVYELVWLRRLQLTFGSTTYSVTTVIAAFMAGLGFGSYLVGRRVDRGRQGGVRTYAYLELGIGAYALVSLPLLGLAESGYVALQSWLGLGQGGAALLKLALAFPVLALPAGLMGGTLPALVKGLVRSRRGLTTGVGLLYGINTAGAAVGTALCGMLLIEALGLWRSVLAAVGVNLLIGGSVLLLLQRGGGEQQAAADGPPADSEGGELRLRRHLRSAPVRFCAVAVVLTGALSMLYEVSWTRMLSMVLGSSTYAFTIVLAIFLVGIALGALIYSRASSGPPGALGLTLVLLALALWVALTLLAIPLMPHAMLWLIQLPGVGFARMLTFEALLALFLLLIPTLLLGAALPMAMGVISRALGSLGRDVGGVYLANTGGAIAGSVLTGFALIPLLGTQRTLLVGLAANLALVAWGVLAFGGSHGRRLAGIAAVAALAAVSLLRPPWPVSVFDAGLSYQHRLAPADSTVAAARRVGRTPSRLLFFEEGVNATISVRRNSEAVALFVNGKPDASSRDDMPHQLILGVLGPMAHPRPRDIGIVGWGSGVTARAATFFGDVRRVEVAEIEGAVWRASPLFAEVNGGVERDPRVRVVFDDARSHFLTRDSTYDVIISQPSNPWMAGVASLFSADFYRLVKAKLNRGGVLAQWIQLYHMDAATVALVFRTILRSFSHVQLWFSDTTDVVLLASDSPLRVPLSRVERAYAADPRLPYFMDVYGPGARPGQLLGCFLLDRPDLERLARRFPDEVTDDDRPLLEYRALRALYRKNHNHMEQLWQAKLRLRRLLPPGAGRASTAEALVGGSNLLRGLPRLRNAVSLFALQHHPTDERVRLQRARVLTSRGRQARALKILRPLLGHPRVGAEAALLSGQALLRAGDPGGAQKLLRLAGDQRPIPRLWLGFKAALALGQHTEAWRLAERLARALDSVSDPDARRMPWADLYLALDRLLAATRDHRRAIRLLTRPRRHYGAELLRLMSLVDAYRGLGDRRRAAATMDRVMAFGLADGTQLEQCQKVYREAGQREKAAACRRQRIQLRDLPAGPPLWD
jgi:spermidine synthase